MTGNELRLKTNSGYKFKDRDAVYITEPDSSPKGKSINVTTKGYYYYDASKKVWIKVNALPYSPSDVSSDNNENNLNNSKK